MSDAELSQESIDRPDLYPVASAVISQPCRLDVIDAIGHQQGDGGKPTEYLIAGVRAGKALEKLLEDESGREDRFTPFDCLNESLYLLRRSGGIAPEREGPHAGVDEKAQARVRPAL